MSNAYKLNMLATTENHRCALSTQAEIVKKYTKSKLIKSTRSLAVVKMH